MNFIRLCSVFLVSFMFTDCSLFQPLNRADTKKDWTVMVYMAADNNLDTYALDDINEMEMALPIDSADVLVYLDRAPGGLPENPVILQITNDTRSEIYSPIIKSLPESDSASVVNLSNFVSFCTTNYPSEHYMLVLWSHGSGWYPGFMSSMAFGVDDTDNGYGMDVTEIARSLASYHFEILIFDACEMADIESVYELKNLSDYIIASEYVICNNGFPYNKMLAVLSGLDNSETCVNNICKSYIDSYMQNGDPYLRNASITGVKTEYIEEFAYSVSNYFANIANTNINALLFDVITQSSATSVGYGEKYQYDLLEILKKADKVISNAWMDDLMIKYSNMVIYHKNSGLLFNSKVISNSSGLSTAFPYTNKTQLLFYYSNYKWYNIACQLWAE